MGSDIKAKNSKALIVFTGLDEDTNEQQSEFIERAKSIKAICFTRDILAIDFKTHYKKSTINFFSIDEDEKVNMIQGLKIIEEYKKMDNVRLYVFAIGVESEMLLAKTDYGNMKVRRVNEIKSLVNRTLYDEGEAKAIVRTVMDECFGMSLADLLCGGIDRMEEMEYHRLSQMMERLTQAEPVQYVVGIAEFCGRTFHVEPGVLIPRPETGELCEWIIASDHHGLTRTNDIAAEKAVRESPRLSDANILDVGTGSGCIAITLALEMPKAKVTAWDISEEALSIARKNAEALGAEINFEQRDILNISTDSCLLSPDSSYDVIVSNPPYVCQKEAATMERHVLEHEPHLALFVPDFYRAIAKYGQKTLKPNGLLYFELNPLYAYDTESMVRELGYAETEIKLDMFGKQRFLKAFNKG